MTASLKALLAGVLDYAGMYPPASQSLEEAVRSWRRHRDDDRWWMLGRFVCPLDKVLQLGWETTDGSVSMVAGRDSLGQFTNSMPGRNRIPNSDWIKGIEAATIPASLILYREFTLDRLEAATSQAAEDGAALKFRTGGTTAAAFPSSADLARVIAVCRDRRVAWKATAGLHHPLPNRDASGGRAHGFINLLTATVLAHARRIDQAKIQEILDDEDSRSFRFDEAGLSWRGLSASTAEIEKSRKESFHSFGCCSFTEPRDDLDALKWFTD